MKNLLVVILASFSLCGCRSQVPSQAGFDNDLTSMLQRANQLKTEGEYFAPSAESQKEVMEDGALLALDRAAEEIRYRDLPEYPNARANAERFLNGAEQILSPDLTAVVNLEKNHHFTQLCRFTEFCWSSPATEGFLAFMLVGFGEVFFVGGAVGTTLYDLLLSWKTERESETFNWSPVLLKRLETLRTELKTPNPLLAQVEATKALDAGQAIDPALKPLLQRTLTVVFS